MRIIFFGCTGKLSTIHWNWCYFLYEGDLSGHQRNLYTLKSSEWFTHFPRSDRMFYFIPVRWIFSVFLHESIPKFGTQQDGKMISFAELPPAATQNTPNHFAFSCFAHGRRTACLWSTTGRVWRVYSQPFPSQILRRQKISCLNNLHVQRIFKRCSVSTSGLLSVLLSRQSGFRSGCRITASCRPPALWTLIFSSAFVRDKLRRGKAGTLVPRQYLSGSQLLNIEVAQGHWP